MQDQDSAVFLRIISKWWWLIILLLGVTIVTMVGITFRTTPSYRASVTIQVSAPPPQEAPLFSQLDRQVASQQIEETRASFAEFVQGGDVAFRVLQRLPQVKLTEDELNERLSVNLPPNSPFMTVQVSAPSPDTAALLANTVSEVSVEGYAQFLAQSTAQTRKFIEDQLKLAETNQQQAVAKLEQFRLQHKIYDVGNAIDDQNRLLITLHQNSDSALTQGRQAEFQALQKIIASRENELQTLIRLVPEYNSLADDVATARSSASFLIDRRNEAQIKENQILSMSSIQMISQARPPQQPVPVFSNTIILFGIASALVAGVLLVFFLEYLETLGIIGRSRTRSAYANLLTLHRST
jgi:uncharacterized protein involved in exopolysaccharide biosynthesis